MKEIEKLRELKKAGQVGGGEEAVKRQHAKGKLTARERIDLLLDAGSFVEFDRFMVHRSSNFDMENKKYLGDGVITGWGKVDGRQVYVFSQDFTVFGGSLGEAFAEKICKITDKRKAFFIPSAAGMECNFSVLSKLSSCNA